MSFYKIYSTFSSSQIRCLQFAFRVILAEGSSSSTDTIVTGALSQLATQQFLNEFFGDKEHLVQSAWHTTPPSVATGWVDLHEWIALIHHMRNAADADATANNSSKSFSGDIVPRILQGAREIQHQRTEVPAGTSVASEKQLMEAQQALDFAQAKEHALRTESIGVLKPFYSRMWMKYEVHFSKNTESTENAENTENKTTNNKQTPKTTAAASITPPSSLSSAPPFPTTAPLLDDSKVLDVLVRIGFWKFTTLVEEELDRLVELRTKNRQDEQKAMLQYANEFSQEELHKFIDQFRSMDNDDGGTIDTVEIGQAFAKAGIDIDDDTLKEVVEEADEDNSGEVDVFEWIGIQKAVRDGTSRAMKLLAEAAMKNARAKELEKKNAHKRRMALSAHRNAILKKFPPQRLAMFRETFDDFDADSSGEVDLDELTSMCEAMDMNVSKKKLKALMDKVDTDHRYVLAVW